MNRFRDAMQPVSFWTSLMHFGGSIFRIAVIFSGLASMSLWLTMKPSSFPAGTPKTHFVGFNFHWNRLRLLKVSVKSVIRLYKSFVLMITSST